MDDQAPAAAPHNGDVKIHYGPKDWQYVTPKLAELVLMHWRGKSPKQFGDVMSAVMTEDVKGT